MNEASKSDWVKDHNAKHVWHPNIDPKALDDDPPLIIADGDGVHVSDIDGNRYLDATAGLWCVNAGHNRPEIKQAIMDQLNRIANYRTFGAFSNIPSIELSARLMEMLKPENMERVMFSSGGSDAAETALKLTRHYWKMMGQPEKTKIFSLKHGYHGVHFGGASAAGGIKTRRAYEPLMPGFYQVDTPYLYRNPWTDDAQELGEICASILDREIEHQGADTVAAFIAEPILGGGGMIVPPDNYWPLVRQVCDKHDILLIADEVVTGFGRSGELFGSRGWGVAPDAMCFAKGINSAYVPLGATVFNERIAKAWDTDHELASINHGHTYSGHPLACAAALANLDIVENENLTDNAARVGAYMQEGLKGLQQRYPTMGDVRGKGLMLAVEFVKDRASKAPYTPKEPYLNELSQACQRRGMIVRALGNKFIISPPLIFTNSHVDELIEILDGSLAEVAP